MKIQFNPNNLLFLDKINKINFLTSLTSSENNKELSVSKYILKYYTFTKQQNDNLRYDYYKLIIKYTDTELTIKLTKACNDYFYNSKKYEDLIKEYEGDDLIYIPMKELIRIGIMRRWCGMCLAELDKNKGDLNLPKPPDVIKYN